MGGCRQISLRPGLALGGPPGDIITRRRPILAAQSMFPHENNVKFSRGPPGDRPPALMASPGLISLLFLAFLSVELSLANRTGLNLAPTEIVAIEGDPFDIQCPAPGAERPPGAACQLDVPGFNSSVSLPSDEAPGHSWTPLGCGVRVDEAQRRHAGLANCTYGGVTTQVRIRVVWPPDKVQMLASNKYFEFTDGLDMNFSCTAHGGSPPDNVSIYLDDELMASSSVLPSVSWGRQAEAADHMKRIRCLVVQPALRTTPAHFSRSLNVKFAPMLVSKQETSVDFEGIATLRVVAKANPPVDQAEWSFNGQILDSDRFSAWNYTNVTKGLATIWTFGLDVDGVTEEDFSSPYELKLSNPVGSCTLQLHLRQRQHGEILVTIMFLTIAILVVMNMYLVLLRQLSRYFKLFLCKKSYKNGIVEDTPSN